jgi:hypothetical protein
MGNASVLFWFFKLDRYTNIHSFKHVLIVFGWYSFISKTDKAQGLDNEHDLHNSLAERGFSGLAI